MLSLNHWRMNQKDPLLFITKVLGSRPDDNQRKIINAIARYNRVAVSSCHSIGKTFTSARLALWFLFCFPKSLVLTTAPTTRQVNFLLWGEIRSAYKSSRVPLGGDLNRCLHCLKSIHENGMLLGSLPNRRPNRRPCRMPWNNKKCSSRAGMGIIFSSY